MQNNLVINFKQQMTDNIYNCAFSSLAIWSKHLSYMLYNPDQDWINILSIFNSRENPKKVLLLEEWKNELDVEPIIHKGISGIPVLTKPKPPINITERIVHNAWDINDFHCGCNYSVESPFLTALNFSREEYGINHDTSFWNDFFSNIIIQTAYKDQCKDMNEFLLDSYLFLISENINIRFSFIEKNKGNNKLLCNIYSKFYSSLSLVLSEYETYTKDLIKKRKKENLLKIALFRSNRKLPERITDAENKVLAERKKSDYNPEDGIERSKI